MQKRELRVGLKAPDFTLKDSSGKLVRLSEFRGKSPVLLVFYPGDMTPGCTMQLCAIRDDWQKFRSCGIVVYGVNHADAESHQTFIKKHTFPFPLLIDTGKKVSKRYGAIKTFFKAIIIKRSVVGIDTEGVIRYLKRGMPKNSEILKAMKPYENGT
ncbi:peroxiredoxin [Candidatus Uhrbacteria bacterium]|nr:peroxiredoxin [Candidatus Uhrbacteria bacterium]